MVEGNRGVGPSGGGSAAASRYALPEYARTPRQRPGLGVVSVLVVGLLAVGLAGFISVSAVSDPGPDRAPVARDTSRDTPERPSTRPQRPESDDEGGKRGNEVLAANPVYDSGEMAEVTCEAPKLAPDDQDSMENFLHEISNCLDEAWTEQFADSGLDFEPPNRIYWYTSGQSPCGNYPARDAAAFYCQANNGLYLGIDDIVRNSGDNQRPEAYTFLLGHEYAHHVQDEAGILGYFHSARGREPRAADRDQLTRRNELQANCLSGTFIHSVGGSFPIGSDERDNVRNDARRRGDLGSGERTHGTPGNGEMWAAQGMDRGDPAFCNTWRANKDVVE